MNVLESLPWRPEVSFTEIHNYFKALIISDDKIL